MTSTAAYSKAITTSAHMNTRLCRRLPHRPPSHALSAAAIKKLAKTPRERAPPLTVLPRKEVKDHSLTAGETDAA